MDLLTSPVVTAFGIDESNLRLPPEPLPHAMHQHRSFRSSKRLPPIGPTRPNTRLSPGAGTEWAATSLRLSHRAACFRHAFTRTSCALDSLFQPWLAADRRGHVPPSTSATETILEHACEYSRPQHDPRVTLRVAYPEGYASQVSSAQGLVLYREDVATAMATARPRSFYPNLIGPDTFCRKSMRAVSWIEHCARRAVTASIENDSPTRRTSRRVLRAASWAVPRRTNPIDCTQGAFHRSVLLLHPYGAAEVATKQSLRRACSSRDVRIRTVTCRRLCNQGSVRP